MFEVRGPMVVLNVALLRYLFQHKFCSRAVFLSPVLYSADLLRATNPARLLSSLPRSRKLFFGMYFLPGGVDSRISCPLRLRCWHELCTPIGILYLCFAPHICFCDSNSSFWTAVYLHILLPDSLLLSMFCSGNPRFGPNPSLPRAVLTPRCASCRRNSTCWKGI